MHAIVVLQPEPEVSIEDLQAFARDQIAGYKVPKSIEIPDEPLPLSGAMKVVKRDLRARMDKTERSTDPSVLTEDQLARRGSRRLPRTSIDSTGGPCSYAADLTTRRPGLSFQKRWSR